VLDTFNTGSSDGKEEIARMSIAKKIENAAIYARVSTSDQNCDMQLRDLREYCQRRGWNAVEYVDTGVSGVKTSREQLDRLMRDARQRKLDLVLCWRFDRFARSTKHLLNALEEFQSLGVGFVSHQEAIDSTTPIGKMMFTVISALAEFERSVLIERVRAGIETARSKGKTLGRPRKVFRRDVAVELRAAGYSWRRLSRELDIPVSTLREACAERPVENSPKKDGKPTRNTRAS
jgi:DNA invertase Pin-like site-specific DNA recombinase